MLLVSVKSWCCSLLSAVLTTPVVWLRPALPALISLMLCRGGRRAACGIAPMLMGETVENVAGGIDCYSIRQPIGVSKGRLLWILKGHCNGSCLVMQHR